MIFFNEILLNIFKKKCLIIDVCDHKINIRKTRFYIILNYIIFNYAINYIIEYYKYYNSKVETNDGQEMCVQYQCQFYEVSAAESSVGVCLAFQSLIGEARPLLSTRSLPAVRRKTSSGITVSKMIGMVFGKTGKNSRNGKKKSLSIWNSIQFLIYPLFHFCNWFFQLFYIILFIHSLYFRYTNRFIILYHIIS